MKEGNDPTEGPDMSHMFRVVSSVIPPHMPNYIATVDCVKTVPIIMCTFAVLTCGSYWFTNPSVMVFPLVTLSVNPSSRKTVRDSQHSSSVKTKYVRDNYVDIT